MMARFFFDIFFSFSSLVLLWFHRKRSITNDRIGFSTHENWKKNKKIKVVCVCCLKIEKRIFQKAFSHDSNITEQIVYIGWKIHHWKYWRIGYNTKTNNLRSKVHEQKRSNRAICLGGVLAFLFCSTKFVDCFVLIDPKCVLLASYFVSRLKP